MFSLAVGEEKTLCCSSSCTSWHSPFTSSPPLSVPLPLSSPDFLLSASYSLTWPLRTPTISTPPPPSYFKSISCSDYLPSFYGLFVHSYT
jgi:hypothetical protein